MPQAPLLNSSDHDLLPPNTELKGAEQGALFEGEPGLAEARHGSSSCGYKKCSPTGQDLDFIAVDLPAREAEPEQVRSS